MINLNIQAGFVQEMKFNKEILKCAKICCDADNKKLSKAVWQQLNKSWRFKQSEALK